MRVRKRFLLFFAAGAVLFLGLVVAAVSVIDSPAKMALRQNDQKRVSDLREIAKIIHEIYKSGEGLPETMPTAMNSSSSRNFMIDQISGESYSYKRLSRHAFELCATFQTSNIDYDSSQGFYLVNEYISLDHQAGKQCFEFDVRSDDD